MRCKPNRLSFGRSTLLRSWLSCQDVIFVLAVQYVPLNLVGFSGCTRRGTGKRFKFFLCGLPFPNHGVECSCRPYRVGKTFEKSNDEDLSPYFGDQIMKKLALLCAAALLTSVSIGCTSSGGSTSSWCRLGSLFPTATSARTSQQVYMTAAGSSAFCNPCDQVSCAPCEPAACSPCEPACNPCDPSCDPCARPSVFSRSIIPGPMQ